VRNCLNIEDANFPIIDLQNTWTNFRTTDPILNVDDKSISNLQQEIFQKNEISN
jgi:hypothetical protein